MSSANQSTLAQAMGMGNSLESMNRVVCQTGTPWASSPALPKTMDTGSDPQPRLFASPVAGGLPGTAPSSGWADAVAPADFSRSEMKIYGLLAASDVPGCTLYEVRPAHWSWDKLRRSK